MLPFQHSIVNSEQRSRTYKLSLGISFILERQIIRLVLVNNVTKRV